MAAKKLPPLTLDELIERARKPKKPTDRPLSIADIAERCQLSRSHLYYLRHGLRTPGEYVMHRLAKGLGVDIEVIRAAVLYS